LPPTAAPAAPLQHHPRPMFNALTHVTQPPPHPQNHHSVPPPMQQPENGGGQWVFIPASTSQPSATSLAPPSAPSSSSYGHSGSSASPYNAPPSGVPHYLPSSSHQSAYVGHASNTPPTGYGSAHPHPQHSVELYQQPTGAVDSNEIVI